MHSARSVVRRTWLSRAHRAAGPGPSPRESLQVRSWQALILVAALLASPAARADIYEWRDASGARHFTNSTDGVPAEYRAVAQVLIADWSRPSPVQAPSAPPRDASVEARPAREVEVVVGPEPWQVRSAGERTIQVGSGGGGGAGVQIQGPLAVASVHASDPIGYAGGFYPPWPWYYPFVTTSFDRGRSRHQTLRMLLQDQFQLDRDGPYAYQRWDQPGAGPALAPFLPRGLPYGVGRYGRVIYR